MIQDTSFLIDILNGDPDAQEVLELIERGNRPEKVASITSLELYEGIHRSQKPDGEKQKVPACTGFEARHSCRSQRHETGWRAKWPTHRRWRTDRSRRLYHRGNRDSRKRSSAHSEHIAVHPHPKSRRRNVLTETSDRLLRIATAQTPTRRLRPLPMLVPIRVGAHLPRVARRPAHRVAGHRSFPRAVRRLAFPRASTAGL